MVSTLLGGASILFSHPFAQVPALAASHGFPPAGTFDCDSPSGIWQKLELDENHDSLFAKFETTTARPGQTVGFSLVWEWRDWRPGATLHIRRCLDVDTGEAVDGVATPPIDSLGGNPADVAVVHPVEQPTFTVMKGPEVRPAVSMPFTLTVPASAPPGSEVCMRAAILADPVEHRNSPPDYDISETVCLTITGGGPPSSPRPPRPSESPGPSEAPPTQPSPSETPAPRPPAPSPPLSTPPPTVLPTETRPGPPEALPQKELPRTGVPFPMLVLAGGLLVLLGVAALAWRPKPSQPTGSPEKGSRRTTEP